MVAVARKFLTPQEYLEAENRAETKHEYVQGCLYDRSGASMSHNRVATNLNHRLGNQLDGTSCEVFGADQRVRIRAAEAFYYPDLSILCGEPEMDVLDPMAYTNPKVIIEILSPSTQERDRTEKFTHYALLDSLTDYLLISQNRVFVAHDSRRESGQTWQYQAYSQLEDVLTIESIGCTLKLEDIYQRVTLPHLELWEEESPVSLSDREEP